MLTTNDVKSILFLTREQKFNFLVALKIAAQEATPFISTFQRFIETPPEAKSMFLNSMNLMPIDVSQFDDAFEKMISSAPDRRLQLVFAPFLREATLEFLRDSPNVEVEQLRAFGQAVYTGDLEGLTWDKFLELQTQPQRHATYIEAHALSILFKFNIHITTRTSYFKTNGELEEIKTAEARSDHYHPDYPTLQFICEGNNDNEEHVVEYTHWYIYEGGYYRTLPDGNCLYNGMAQWLRMLLRTEQPEHIASLYATQDSFLKAPVLSSEKLENRVPKHIPTTERIDHALALQSLIDEQSSVAVIRKEFELLDLTSSNLKLLLEGIDSVIQKLKQLCDREAKFSVHALNQLLNNLSTSQQLLSDNFEPNHRHVLALFGITRCILNALYLPDSSDKKSHWTKERYNQNLTTLYKLAAELLDSDCEDFKNIGGAVVEMNFRTLALDPIKSPKTRKKSSSLRVFQDFCRLVCTHYLLPSLRILAYTLMIASVLSLIFFIALALFPKTAFLLGPYLVASGLKNALVSLAIIIGFKAPASVSSLAMTGSLASAAGFGLGQTLFNAYDYLKPTRTPQVSRLIRTHNITT